VYQGTVETGAKIIAVGIAAKLIHDMVIEYKTSQTKDEKKVVKEYSKKNKTLPSEPKVVEYETSIKPGDVVKAGKEVQVVSRLVVVPGNDGKPVEIKEEINIFDNEDNTKSLKNLTKPVNEKTKQTGEFKNQFKFTLPEGMPQGVYPIKTLVLLNGKTSNPSNNKMQLVLDVDQNHQYRILAVNQ
jgi:DNA-directed RNA polymerase subunit H (RpoH/RPB5)